MAYLMDLDALYAMKILQLIKNQNILEDKLLKKPFKSRKFPSYAEVFRMTEVEIRSAKISESCCDVISGVMGKLCTTKGSIINAGPCIKQRIMHVRGLMQVMHEGAARVHPAIALTPGLHYPHLMHGPALINPVHSYTTRF